MKTLLLVEDDPKISLALGIRLKSSGYAVFTAPDAVHAMAQAVKHNPDAVVLDINLPGGDGFMVAERLRARGGDSLLPIVFITASKKPGLSDRARALRATSLIEKPFSAAELIEAIESALSGRDDGVYDFAV